MFLFKPFFMLLLFIASSSTLLAQYNETIRTARPGKSVGPFTTGNSIFQIQSGLNILNLDNGVSDVSGSLITQLNSLRYGITETIEIRSAFSYLDQITNISDSEIKMNGINFWNVGLRVNLVNNAGSNKPSIGIQGDVGLKTVSNDFEPKYFSPRLLLLMSMRLTKTFAFTTNLGTQWSGSDGKQSGIYTLNLGFAFAPKLRGFIENYGSYQGSDLTARFDTGLGYLINNNFAIDLSTGYGDNNDQTDYFIDFGISYRFKV